MSFSLPAFPWDALAPAAERARAHPHGLVDLSVGSPVDPTPTVIRDALAAASDAHSYPLTVGSGELREAIAGWFERRRGVSGLDPANVFPTVGSKEFVAGLPLWLGLGPADVVVHPRTAYPTYAIGAALVGARVHESDDPRDWPEKTRLVWINTPGNPDGRVMDVAALRAAVARARQLGAVIASDECYAELGWDEPRATGATPSVLDPSVTGGDAASVLAVYSLSKQSNLAGYRAGLVGGDAELAKRIVEVRKHLGLIVPAPVQAAMVAALSDDAHVGEQRERYRARRAILKPAFERAGFRVDHSVAGLYLWATRREDAWASVDAMAGLGILVAPGTFYGQAGAQHIRVAITATDERIAAAAARLDASAR